jgi:hypothetical protein
LTTVRLRLLTGIVSILVFFLFKNYIRIYLRRCRRSIGAIFLPKLLTALRLVMQLRFLSGGTSSSSAAARGNRKTQRRPGIPSRSATRRGARIRSKTTTQMPLKLRQGSAQLTQRQLASAPSSPTMPTRPTRSHPHAEMSACCRPPIFCATSAIASVTPEPAQLSYPD